jgi:hypothetical protein
VAKEWELSPMLHNDELLVISHFRYLAVAVIFIGMYERTWDRQWTLSD